MSTVVYSFVIIVMLLFEHQHIKNTTQVMLQLEQGLFLCSCTENKNIHTV